MMGFLLGAFVVILWLATGIGLVAGGGYGLYRVRAETFDKAALAVGSGVAVLGGLALLLLFGAVVTGDLSFNGVQDGCYHVYQAGAGKTRHTEYDPIPCPWGIQP